MSVSLSVTPVNCVRCIHYSGVSFFVEIRRAQAASTYVLVGPVVPSEYVFVSVRRTVGNDHYGPVALGAAVCRVHLSHTQTVRHVSDAHNPATHRRCRHLFCFWRFLFVGRTSVRLSNAARSFDARRLGSVDGDSTSQFQPSGTHFRHICARPPSVVYSSETGRTHLFT